jgi:hypothetical protein
MIYLFWIIIAVIIGSVIWASKSMMKESENDWKMLEDFEKRSKTLKTKKEIEDFHYEFSEKANKIKNEFITPRLAALDGYLRGLYQQYRS